jgi:hypothetical protein
MSLIFQVRPLFELGICKEYRMARKTNGTTTPRSRKTTAPESNVIPPTPVQVAAEVRSNVTSTAMAGTKTGVNLDEEIRRRAYELYLQRNGAAGDPNRDWFVAEREIRSRYAAQEQRHV